jgi:hypothetical protein
MSQYQLHSLVRQLPPFVCSDQIQDLEVQENEERAPRNKRTQNKKRRTKERETSTNILPVFPSYLFIFGYLIAYQPMEISDFPWAASRILRLFSVLALHIVPACAPTFCSPRT